MILQKHREKIISVIILISVFIFDVGCPIHYLTGLHCPGCGVTRMLLSILKGDFYQAFRYNSLAFLYLIIFIIYEILYLFYNKLKKKNIKFPNLIIYIMIVIAIIFGILRNIDLFNWLAPTIIN